MMSPFWNLENVVARKKEVRKLLSQQDMACETVESRALVALSESYAELEMRLNDLLQDVQRVRKAGLEAEEHLKAGEDYSWWPETGRAEKSKVMVEDLIKRVSYVEWILTGKDPE